MLKKFVKSVGSVFIAAMMLFSLSTAAFAASSVPDLDRTGSISVTLEDSDGNALEGVGLTLYQVGEVNVTDTGLEWALTEDFADCGESLEDPEADGLAQSLADYADAEGLSGQWKKVSGGEIKFSGLELGLYLLVQSDDTDYTIDPFLVTVPGEDGDEWVYDVDASPKTEVVSNTETVTVTKVWNDGYKTTKDGKKVKTVVRPDSITVTLYRDGDEVDTVTLTESEDWTYTWENMPASDAYSVQEESLKNYTATYTQDGDYDFTITNTQKLVQTGQLNWPVPVMAGCGVVLFAIGWSLVYLKRKRNA